MGLRYETGSRANFKVLMPRCGLHVGQPYGPTSSRPSCASLLEEQAFGAALLQPLTTHDIAVAASSLGVDAGVFLAQVETVRAESLAKQPLTLRMLLSLCQKGRALPSTLRQLLADGLRELATDRYERFIIGTGLRPSPDDLLAAAERVACYTVLSGRETVDLGDEPPTDHLNWADIVGLPDGHAPLDRELLLAVGSSGLCGLGIAGIVSDSAIDSSRSIWRANGLRGCCRTRRGRCSRARPGWKSGVAGPLRETAAFAAMANAHVAEWLASWDPEVVGLSDVADHDLRRTTTLGLLDRFRRGDMTDAQLRPGEIELARFSSTTMPMLTCVRCSASGTTACEDVLECAIDLIRSWKLSSMSDDLADLALDSAAPLQSRLAAGYALFKCGTDAAPGTIKVPLNDRCMNIWFELPIKAVLSVT